MTRLTDTLHVRLVGNESIVLHDEANGTEIVIPIEAASLVSATMRYFDMVKQIHGNMREATGGMTVADLAAYLNLTVSVEDGQIKAEHGPSQSHG